MIYDMKRLALAFALTSSALILPSISNADLQVFPTRLLLTDQQKSAQISIRHRGTQQMRYRIDVVYYKMRDDGAMEQLQNAKDGERSAVDYFRYSPRQVTLQPNVEQVLRVLLRTPPELPEGEYRAHLYFEGIDEGDEKMLPVATGEGAQMLLKARMAVAVPVIVRKGEPKMEVSLSNLKLVTKPNEPMAYSVEVNRKGLANLYGDFNLYFTPKDGGAPVLVSQANGVSSYIDKRTVSYPLTVPKLNKGILKLEVKDSVSNGGKVLATMETEIN